MRLYCSIEDGRDNNQTCPIRVYDSTCWVTISRLPLELSTWRAPFPTILINKRYTLSLNLIFGQCPPSTCVVRFLFRFPTF